MHENEIAKIVFDTVVKIHKKLGPGLLESAYEKCLVYELRKKGLFIENQVILPLRYDDIIIDEGYRLDVLVENKVILELKAVLEVNDIYKAQLLTYLKLSGCKLGLLINFNVPYIGKGFQRIINGEL